MRRLLQEPLLHFLLAGILLFVLYAWQQGDAPPQSDRIFVSAGQIDALVSGWQRMWQRPPNEAEVEHVIDEYIRDEIFYREALKLGLERDDKIIRRRLRQKMEFLAEDFYHQGDPGDDALAQFLATNPQQFRKPARLTFRHIYFSPDRRGESARDDAQRALDELRIAGSGQGVETLGDPFFLPLSFVASSETDVARALGADFVPKLLAATLGEWSGPWRSGFGYHLVEITARKEGRLPRLSEIRADVLLAWQRAERKKFAQTYFQNLRDQYSITVDRTRVETAASPSGGEP